MLQFWKLNQYKCEGPKCVWQTPQTWTDLQHLGLQIHFAAGLDATSLPLPQTPMAAMCNVLYQMT